MTDRRERIADWNLTFRLALQNAQADLWTALPGIIQSFDPVAMTCEVQPTIRMKITGAAFGTYKSPTIINDSSGNFAWDKLPVLLDCPVFFPAGGGCTLTFPIKEGDECLVIFASRCIDAWWQSGGIQNQAAFRMHDLSDGFVFAGVRSQPRVISNISTSSVQLRTDDGTAFMDLDPTTHVMTLTATTLNINANVAITGTVTDNGVDISSTHVHGGVTAGSDDTGVPV